jgi:glycine/D-amino acid oxidase-like deaminating enzyme
MSVDLGEGVDVAVVGAGNAGIAAAYYLVVTHGVKRVALIDPRAPMSLTSAQSGENYRNWWPHPVMTALTDHSIGLMEALDRESGGRLNITRGGYALVTRRTAPGDLIDDLHRGYQGSGHEIRIHESAASSYAPPRRTPWSDAPDGVDVLLDRDLIRATFPSFAPDVGSVIHIRRAGSISAQQMGQYMLEQMLAKGARLVRAEVTAITAGSNFALEMKTPDGSTTLRADKIVNAAGPFLRDVAGMLGEELPVKCIYQQKIAFEDRAGAIPRDLPFSIDLDVQTLAWTDEDRELLAGDDATRHLTEPMIGGVHCRPDGPASGRWVKLGWAYNEQASDPHLEEPIDPQFPDTVLRGASRLNPSIAAYIGHLPRGARHYGGYYAMTEENWPLIGTMQTEGAFVVGALSGFGSMAACAAGALCAAWVTGSELPPHALPLSRARHADKALMEQLESGGKGRL